MKEELKKKKAAEKLKRKNYEIDSLKKVLACFFISITEALTLLFILLIWIWVHFFL